MERKHRRKNPNQDRSKKRKYQDNQFTSENETSFTSTSAKKLNASREEV